MPKFLQALRRIHPQYSLFGRIFLWFWLAVTLMIVGTFVIARFLGQTWELSESNNEQIERLQKFATNIELQVARNNDLERALRRTGARSRSQLLLVEQKSSQLVFGFPRQMLSQEEKFIGLVDASEPLLIRTNNMEFVGPATLSLNNKTYYLFAGKLLRRDQRPFMLIGTALVVFLVVGTLACIGIAFTIVKPIKRLQELSNEFATGNSQEPDAYLSKRKDELGQLHQDIYQMASNLALSLRQQKELMANVSHELRTPLTRMQLAVAMLEPKDDKGQQYAARIEKEIGVMDTLIGQSLQLAKMDSQHKHSQSMPQIMPLSKVLTPLLDDLSFEAKASHKTIEFNAFPDVTLPLHQPSFVSAIENVTRNAIKFSKHALSVQISLAIQAGAKQLIISIEDDGEGLPSAQAQQIFEPFYRAKLGQEQQGTGLGLAIAKAAVELHHGTIKVSESSLGGLNITLSFPVAAS